VALALTGCVLLHLHCVTHCGCGPGRQGDPREYGGNFLLHYGLVHWKTGEGGEGTGSSTPHHLYMRRCHHLQ